MTTASTISFQNPNSGMQTGINTGTINAQFNLHADPLDKLPTANGAEFDSYANQHEDECLPGTRTELLKEIVEWSVSPQGKCIFWLNGMAGTGKSTISRTVAKCFKQEKILGASFFFKRGEGDRGNAMKLFPTITRQLAKSISQLIPGVQKAIHDNSDIGTKGLKEQFDTLLLQPLLGLDPSALPIPILVILLDALDECNEDSDMRLVLQLLPRLQESKAVRLRVFLTSRPEWPIFQELSNITSSEHEDLILHQIPEPVIEHDISLFLKHRLLAIRTDRSLPVNWPGDIDIQKLVTLSVPLFIYAATVCRIFEDPQWDPADSLTEIFTHQKDGSQFNGTYLPVLNRLLQGQSKKQEQKLVGQYQELVGPIVLLESPLSVVSLSKLLGLSKEQIRLKLCLLHSVLNVPEDNSLPVRLFHLSFRDFLLDPDIRDKTPFWVDEKETQQRLATRCLLICGNLRRNICELPSHGTQRAEIDRQIIDRCLSSELQYACRYWAHHLVRSKDRRVMMHEVLLFLQVHCLHWMEAMSILGSVSDIVGIINLLQTVIHDDKNSALADFLHDAKRFILKNSQVAHDAPLQLYCSGLIFAPQKSVVRKQFQTEIPNWICQLPQVEESWSIGLQTLEGHSDSVESVAFSPNGQLLASGSRDNTVRLWDTVKGALQHTLEGHLNWVQSVAFSPDGKLMASGSRDNTVRLWDTVIGALRQTLEAHSNSVESVAFSPDGGLLASGSHDKTVRLWDTATGALQQTLEGHLSPVQSVAFSPNGRLLASGSYNERVRLWDTATGALHQTLEGHLDSVNSVAFSPDGKLMASGSRDDTVRLWDTAIGTLQQTIEAHSNSVELAAFSPDGRLLASGSDDKIVRLWDTVTGALQQTLEGHLSRVRSVAFSPDGRLLASGSRDETVRLWDTATGALKHILEGHSDGVLSVEFSPDSRLLASGSYDETVLLWNTATGALQQTLEGHSYWIQTLAFSPDGRLLASGSHDKTVRLWDTATGALHQTLEDHSKGVQKVAFSPDSQLLASGCYEERVRLWDTATGALHQTLSMDGEVCDFEFSYDGSYLRTNIGSLDIQSNYGNHVPHSPKTNPEIYIQRRHWIALNGEQVLWLPPETRPGLAIKANTLALGHPSGRISFIGFRV